MKLINTGDPQIKPSVVMMVYGEGGVGKTTFASTAPKPLLLDFENGSKYFGMRGIKVDVALVESWEDIRNPEFLKVLKDEKFETIIIDPIGEAMDKLKTNLVNSGQSKFVQASTGDLTMAGWGELKKRMRNFVKSLRDSGKNVIIVAHIEEKDDEGRLVKRPKVETKLSEELVNMVDIVAYMTVTKGNEDDEDKRILIVDPTSDKIVAKDRTGRLGKYIEPDFSKIVNACQGTKTYEWSKEVVKDEPKEEAPSKAKTVQDKLEKAKVEDGK